MNKLATQQPKLTEPQKMKVVAMLAKGLTYKNVIEKVKEDFDVSVSVAIIKKIRDKNESTITAMQDILLTAEVTGAVNIKNRALKNLDKKLERIQAQEDRAEDLYQQYINGDITDIEYKKQRSLLTKISARDLSSIAKDLHSQADPAPAGPVAAGPGQDPKWVDSLLQAVQRGDTIAMQQLIITPNANDQKI